MGKARVVLNVAAVPTSIHSVKYPRSSLGGSKYVALVGNKSKLPPPIDPSIKNYSIDSHCMDLNSIALYENERNQRKHEDFKYILYDLNVFQNRWSEAEHSL